MAKLGLKSVYHPVEESQSKIVAASKHHNEETKK
jgi:hypothetical protein